MLVRKGLYKRMQQISPNQTDSDLPPVDAESLTDDIWGPGRQLWLRLRSELRGQGSDQQTPIRLASHLALLLVAAGFLLLSRIELPQWDVAQRSLLPGPPATVTPITLSQLVAGQGGVTLSAAGPLIRNAVPFTTIPERPRLEIESYAVQPGDTVFGIAAKFGLQPETIMWSNRDLELNPDLLRVSDTLTILPVDGVYHAVKAGDTVVALAKKYKVQPAAIVSYSLNALEGEGQTLQTGSYLIIPGGEKPFVPKAVNIYSGPIPAGAKKGTGAFVWPASGSVTQQYWNGHRAIDIGSWTGNLVVASDSGYVVHAGWDATGYGNLIIVDHGNGYRTYYAHLNSILVRVGESVGQGQRIGSVGNTGNSTGPHLHFEIRYNNVLRNPFGFLR